MKKEGNMGYFMLKDFMGMHISRDNCPMDFLLAVAEVAAMKYEEEKSKESSRSSKQERLIKEKALKKPMIKPVIINSPKKQLGFEGEKKFMDSAVQARSARINGRLKRSYGSRDQADFDFKINQKPTSGMRSEKRRKLDVPTLPNPPPDLPEELKNRIKAVGGTETFMVIQKCLTDTDLNKYHGRLSMPFGKIDMGFLRERERDLLARQMTMVVPFMEPSNKVSDIVLRQWDMGKDSGKTSSMYVLRTHWKEVTIENKLKADDVIQVWSFRVGREQQLRMALVVVSRAKTKS